MVKFKPAELEAVLLSPNDQLNLRFTDNEKTPKEIQNPWTRPEAQALRFWPLLSLRQTGGTFQFARALCLKQEWQHHPQCFGAFRRS